MNLSEVFIRRPIATSLAITLYLTPVVYTSMAAILKTRRVPAPITSKPATA